MLIKKYRFFSYCFLLCKLNCLYFQNLQFTYVEFLYLNYEIAQLFLLLLIKNIIYF